MNLPRFACILIAMALLGAGCPPFSAPDPHKDKTAEQVVAETLARRASLTSMESGGSMRIADANNDFYLGVNIEVHAVAPSHMRIKADKLGGRVRAFDVLLVKDEILFYIPRKKALYRGKVEDLKKAKKGFDLKPNSILARLLQNDNFLDGRTWKRLPQEELVLDDFMNRGFEHLRKNKTIQVEEVVEAGQPSLLLEMDRDLNVISIQHRDSAGEVTFQEDYSAYERVADGPQKDKYFPHGMRLYWPGENKEITVSLKKLSEDKKIDESVWELETDEDTRTRPLLQVRIESDKESAEKLSGEEPK